MQRRRWLSGLIAALVTVGFRLFPHAQTPASVSPAVYVVSYVEVMPSSATQGKAVLKAYRGASRSDAGAVALEVFEKADRPGHFALIETWSDQKASMRTPGLRIRR